MSPNHKYLRHQLWQQVLDVYGNCKPTVASDRLVAIAGIAKHIKGIVADQYIMGLRKTFLASELLWWRSVDQELLRLCW